MSSIRSILEQHFYQDGNVLRPDGNKSVIDQALKDISELIDGVIGEDEVFVDIPVLNGNGHIDYRIKGNSYTPLMLARNNLRTQQRNRKKELLK